MRKLAAYEAQGAWVVPVPTPLLADAEDPLLAAVQAGLSGNPRAIVLDMSRVQLADTAGLGTLVSVLHLAQERGVPVVFAGATGRPRILLQRIQLDRHAAIHDSLQSALDGFSA